MAPLALLEAIGNKRGALTKAGVDFTKAGEAVLNDVRSGKIAAIGRIVGAAMKLAGGKADAKTVNDAIKSRLGV
jgi:aspartyl-tRNA(Asn)/glutamyl-tRNA(Gln) amidotransferase subunit B